MSGDGQALWRSVVVARWRRTTSLALRAHVCSGGLFLQVQRAAFGRLTMLRVLESELFCRHVLIVIPQAFYAVWNQNVP